MPVPPHLTGLAHGLARGVVALLAWQRGEVDEGLAALQRDPFLVPAHVAPHPFVSLGLERYILGDLLHRRGRTEDAVEWLQGIAELSALDLIFVPPASPPLQDVRLVVAGPP